jgi:hypothetical protein
VGTIRLKFMAINDPAFERWLISKCRALYVGLGYDPELGWLGVAAICLFLLFACLPWRFGPSAARA